MNGRTSIVALKHAASGFKNESYGDVVVNGKHALLDTNDELFIINLP